MKLEKKNEAKSLSNVKSKVSNVTEVSNYKKSKNETRANVQNICADSANPNQNSSNKIPTVVKKYKKIILSFHPFFPIHRTCLQSPIY
jgi:hypothetical protein